MLINVACSAGHNSGFLADIALRNVSAMHTQIYRLQLHVYKHHHARDRWCVHALTEITAFNVNKMTQIP